MLVITKHLSSSFSSITNQQHVSSQVLTGHFSTSNQNPIIKHQGTKARRQHKRTSLHLISMVTAYQVCTYIMRSGKFHAAYISQASQEAIDQIRDPSRQITAI